MFEAIKLFYNEYCIDCTVWKENNGLDPKFVGTRSVCVSRGCPHDFADLLHYFKFYKEALENAKKLRNKI